MQNKLKYLMSIMLVFTLLLPINTYANDTYHPIFEQSSGAMIKLLNHAAVVGKVIEFNNDKQQYVVYGRLSADAGSGYKVYHSGMFFVAEPDNDTVKSKLDKMASEGKGVKLFGRYSSTYNAETVMYFTRVEEYDPTLDYSVGLQPAYTDIMPSNWYGFGIHKHINSSHLTSFDKTTDFVDKLHPLIESLKTGSKETREIITDEKGKVALVEGNSKYIPNEFKKVFKNDVYRDETPSVVPNITNNKRESHGKYLSNLKSKIPLKNINYLISTNEARNESLNSVGGTVFVNTLQGESNHYLKSIPITRPDIDRFLSVLEGKNTTSFSEWADNGLYYGKVKPIYTTIEIAGELVEIYSHSEFTGSYFPKNKVTDFLDSIEGYSKEILEKKAYNYSDKDDEDKFRNKENWTIENMDEQTALRLEKAGYTWLTGTRYLTYRLPCYCGAKDCPGYYDVTVDYGNMKDDPEANLIERYMTYNKTISKIEMDFTLSVLRESVF